MATSSITANFICNDSKAANAFVRMLVQPVKVIKRDPNACHAAEFKSDAEMRAFCLKMARVARKRTAERARATKRKGFRFSACGDSASPFFSQPSIH